MLMYGDPEQFFFVQSKYAEIGIVINSFRPSDAYMRQ